MIDNRARCRAYSILDPAKRQVREKVYSGRVRPFLPSRTLIACLALTTGLCRCEPFDTATPIDGGGPDGAASSADASAPEAGPSDGGASSCVEPLAPITPCFLRGACIATTRDVSANVSSVDLRNPHGLALDGRAVYFAVQEGTVDGRNANARGAIFRHQGQVIERVTELKDAPAFLVARGGYLYWRVASQRATNDWEVRRARLPMAVCGASCPAPIETVASVRGAAIEGIYPMSESALFLKFGSDQLHMSRLEAGKWSTNGIAIPRSTPARMAKGRRAFWGQGRDLWRLEVDGPVQEHAGTGTDPQMKLLHTTCSSAVVYDDGLGGGPLHQIANKAVTPVDCGGAPGCHVMAPTFDLDSDAGYFYVARPNGGGLQAISRSGGSAVPLADGDVWDVAVDDDFVYFTDVAAASVRRIAKR